MNAVQSFTLTVDAAPRLTSADNTTFSEGHEGSFTVTATGNPAPGIVEHGTLPEGVGFNPTTDKLSGTPTQGQLLTESHGSWSNSPTGYSYQWQDCDSAGNNCFAADRRWRL